MALYDVFRDLPTKIFKIFESLQLPGVHIIVNDDGWGGAPTKVEHPMDVIMSSMEKADVEHTAFYELIQPTDIIIMVKGVDVVDEFDSSHKFQLTHKGGKVVTYSIVAFDTDPAKALYLVLLRGTN